MPTLRIAQRTDAHAMWRIFVSAIRATSTEFYTPEQIEAWANAVTPEDFERRFDKLEVITLVAESNGDVIGFGKLDTKRAVIDALYVDPACQGTGAGKLLMDAMLRICTERGISEVYLNSSLPALGFYKRCGFKEVDREDYELASGVEMKIVRMQNSLIPI